MQNKIVQADLCLLHIPFLTTKRRTMNRYNIHAEATRSKGYGKYKSYIMSLIEFCICRRQNLVEAGWFMSSRTNEFQSVLVLFFLSSTLDPSASCVSCGTSPGQKPVINLELSCWPWLYGWHPLWAVTVVWCQDGHVLMLPLHLAADFGEGVESGLSLGLCSVCPVRSGWGTGVGSAWRREIFRGSWQQEVIKRVEPNSSQWCLVGQWGPEGINWNMRGEIC